MVEMGIEYINITIIWVIDKVLDTSGGGRYDFYSSIFTLGKGVMGWMYRFS